MSYYHVLLSFQDEPNTVRCMFADLAEQELRTRFVTPYRRGKNLLCGGEVVELSEIKTVQIFRTAETSDQELKKIQEKSIKYYKKLNRDSDSTRLVFFGFRGSQLEDISEAGDVVTSTFIAGPPGHGNHWAVVAAVLNNPWISTIGAGLVVAALIWWFGWN
jgi:hypothetical protein